jgi:osmoprotectant transport system substrate-binding protein
MRKLFRNRILGATVVALALVAAACGSGEDADTEGPTIVVGSTNFGEQEILGEIFAQALENAGYPVETKFQLGSREVVNPALKDGQIDLMAEYTGTLLTFEGGTSSTDTDQTHSDLIEVMEPQGITVLDYAPAQDKNGFVVTKATADEFGFEKVSDLASENGNLVLGGPPECPERPLCLQGLTDVYGLEFASFQPLDVGGPLTVAALEGGEIEVGLLFTSDGVIAAKGFVLLEDDQNLQPAENIVPVIRTEVLDQYDDALSDLLNDVASKITTAELSELNKRFGIDAEDADTLAREWLADNGF